MKIKDVAGDRRTGWNCCWMACRTTLASKAASAQRRAASICSSTLIELIMQHRRTLPPALPGELLSGVDFVLRRTAQ